jgi:hypothetical protein
MKAYFPIVLIESGNLRLVKLLQPSNDDEPNLVTVLGKETFSSDIHFLNILSIDNQLLTR